jgi:predicted ATPase
VDGAEAQLITKLRITNYRSIADATIELRPFTILVGANGSGKSNLLKLLFDLSRANPNAGLQLVTHFCAPKAPSRIDCTTATGTTTFQTGHSKHKAAELRNVVVYSLQPGPIAGSEQLVENPRIQPDGTGAVQVLDSLKTGDREDLFDTIERQLCEFVPEIEKLSFVPGAGAKQLQVRERGIPTPVLVRDLSEGTRLVMTILTIVHQELKPSIICLEDIDRGLHPALFGKVVDVCRALSQETDAPQIIATTHNPYVVDQFVDDEDSVVIVEKADGNTTFTSLRTRLEGLERGSETLGGVWYSGLVGGTPVARVRHLPRSREAK